MSHLTNTSIRFIITDLADEVHYHQITLERNNVFNISFSSLESSMKIPEEMSWSTYRKTLIPHSIIK